VAGECQERTVVTPLYEAFFVDFFSRKMVKPYKKLADTDC